MKKILIITAVIFASSLATSQNYKITKGKETADNAASQRTFGEDDKSFYKFRKEGKKEESNYFVEKFDKATLKKVWTLDAKFSEFKYSKGYMYTYVFDASDLFEAYFTDKNILLFVTYFNLESKEANLMMKIVGLDGKMEKDWTKIYSMQAVNMAPSHSKYFVCMSPDKSKIAVVSDFKWDKKPQVVTAQFYNINTMEKMGSQLVLPEGYKAGGISSTSYSLDNAGNFSYLFYYLADAKDESTSLGFSILPNNSKTPKVVELPMEQGKSLDNYITTTTKDGKIMYSGFFHDRVAPKSKQESKEGVYNFTIDIATATLVGSDVRYFPDDVETKLHYKAGLVEAPTGSKYYSIKSVTEMDGNYYVFSNHNYTISDGHSESTFEREFIVTKINGKGKIEWVKVYPKFTVDKLNSYNMMVHNHKIYVFYLEHPKNLENSNLQDYDAKSYKSINSYHGSVMVGMELNADGSASRKSIAETEEWFYDPSAVNTLLEKENSLLIRMVNGKKERFDILKVE